MAKKEKFLLIIFSLFLLALILLSSYKISISLTDLTPHQQSWMNFFSGKDEEPQNYLNYTSAEISHMNDVRKIMNFTDYAFYISLLICTGIITGHHRNREFLKKAFLYGGIFTAGFLALLLICIFFSFDSAWGIFHRIFFPQGNWQFPAGSLLIQTFPIEFFIGMSYKIFLTSLAEGSLFILLGYFLGKNEIKRP